MPFLFALHRFNYSLFLGICFGIVIVLFTSPMSFENNCYKEDFSEETHNFRELRSHQLDKKHEKDVHNKISSNHQMTRDVKKANKNDEPFIRPRFYSLELGIRDKVLISILSSLESLDNFGVAINKTLHNYVDKLLFFVDGLGDIKLKTDLTVIGFKDSKPDINIFRVLSYVGENFLSKYEFFLFITDHSYIHGIHLQNLLHHMSVGQDVHMGALSDMNSKFCSLDGGIILSRTLFTKVFSDLRWCAKNIKSKTLDANFGFCILNSTKTQCSSSFQFLSYKSYLLHNNQDAQSHLEYIGQNTFIKEATTIRGLTNYEDIYKIHYFYLQKHAQSLTKDLLQLSKSFESNNLYPLSKQKNIWPSGSLDPHLPPSRHDVIRWESFNSTHLFLPNDFENTKGITDVDLYDIMNVVNGSISFLNSKLSSSLLLENIDYGYRRFDPTRGMDYILHLTLKDQFSGNSFSKIMNGYRGLTTPQFITVPYMTESNHVTFVTFVTMKDVAEAIGFIERVEKFKQINHITISFNLILQDENSLQYSNDPFEGLKKKVEEFTEKFYDKETRASWSAIHIGNELPHPISLVDIALRKVDRGMLVVLIELTAHFTQDFISRICLNTIPKWQAFSPIPFVMYHPKVVEDAKSYASMQINRRNGHFDKYHFRTIAFYVSDFLTVRKSYTKMLPIVRSDKEIQKVIPSPSQPLSVYFMFQKSTLIVLRGVEPELVLGYSKVVCPPHLDSNELGICFQRRCLSYGTKEQLSKLVIDFKNS